MLNAFMTCYLSFMSWTLCFLRRPRVSVSYCMHGGLCYLLVGLCTLYILRRPRVGVLASCIRDMLLILYVLDSLFLATHKSKRVSFPPPCAHFVCCWGVHSSPSSLLAGTLLLFWSVHTSWLLGFLTLFGLCCCVRWIFCQPRQAVAQKIVGGFLRLEKRIFFILFVVFCVILLFFLALSLARGRPRERERRERGPWGVRGGIWGSRRVGG